MSDPNEKSRIVFMGTSEFADEILSSMIEASLNVVAVFTKSDKKNGRAHEIKESKVKLTAQKNNISVFQPEKLDSDAIAEVNNKKPNLIVVAAYGKIIPSSILEIPEFGVINVHPSLLPKYRGPSPIQNAILNGENETGTTIMLMNEGIDTGDILNQVTAQIEKNETREMLEKKLAKLSSNLLLETIPLWISRKIEPKKQNNQEATLCQLIEKDDGRIIWTEDAQSIYNRHRALFPWPGIFTYWENEEKNQRIKLNKISFIKNNPEIEYHTGEVFQIGEKIGVKTSLGVIFLEEIQLEGKNIVKTEDFINGYPKFLGSILK